MNYLDLVEEYEDRSAYDLSQFDRVRFLATRAKDLYSGKTTSLKNVAGRKATAVAQYELRKGLIISDIHEKEETPNTGSDFYDDEE